jgi:hypothetical protein
MVVVLAQRDYLCWWGVLGEAYFRELRYGEVRRIPLLGTWVNKAHGYCAWSLALGCLGELLTMT